MAQLALQVRPGPRPVRAAPGGRFGASDGDLAPCSEAATDSAACVIASPAVLHDIGLKLGVAELVAFAGRSGSGESTLCHLIAGLGRPTSGRILAFGRPADQVDDWATVALLPQRRAVVEELSVLENTAYPPTCTRRPAPPARSAASCVPSCSTPST